MLLLSLIARIAARTHNSRFGLATFVYFACVYIAATKTNNNKTESINEYGARDSTKTEMRSKTEPDGRTSDAMHIRVQIDIYYCMMVLYERSKGDIFKANCSVFVCVASRGRWLSLGCCQRRLSSPPSPALFTFSIHNNIFSLLFIRLD